MRIPRYAASLPSDSVQAFSVIVGSHLEEDAGHVVSCGHDRSGGSTTSPRLRGQVRLSLLGSPNAFVRPRRGRPDGRRPGTVNLAGTENMPNGRCTAMGRQKHVESRSHLNSSAFGLITDVRMQIHRKIVRLPYFSVYLSVTVNF